MMAIKGKKINPGLFTPAITFSEPFVSKFHSYLMPGLSIGSTRIKNEKSVKWDTMPISLKNSLFYFGENFEKYRKLEVGYKFFVTDELKEKGNICYNKENI